MLFRIQKLRQDRGFTLTELAIGMLVIGILASVAIPSFLGPRNNAYDKDAQNSINAAISAALTHYQSQGDFSTGSTASCGTDAGASIGIALAADLQKLQPNVDFLTGNSLSTNPKQVSIDARPTFNSNGENLGCQAFYATALSLSGTCWIGRYTVEGKFLLTGSVSPIQVSAPLNTVNASVVTFTLLQVNGAAFAQIRARSAAADADNSVTLALIAAACKAVTQSTGVAATAAYYAAPSEFYAAWKDSTTAGSGAGN